MKQVMKVIPTTSWIKVGAYFVLGALTGLILLISLARLIWHSKYYPGVSVAGVSVAGHTREEARAILNERIATYSLTLTYNGARIEVPREVTGVVIDEALSEAYRYGRRLEFADYLLLLFSRTHDYPLALASESAQAFDAHVEQIAPTVEFPPVDPSIVVANKKVTITNGEDGHLIDRARLRELVRQAAINLRNEPIEIPTVLVQKTLTQDMVALVQSRAEKLADSTLILTQDDERITLAHDELVSFLATSDVGETALAREKIDAYVSHLSENLTKEAQNARFVFEDGEVKEFAPGKDGIEVSIQLTADGLQQAILKLLESEEKTITTQIPVTRIAPQVTTDKVNDLGIKERIGRGESYYAHSIPNRVYNVGLAATRTHSALIPPGEEYSFNREVGEISGATGYKTAYVISGGRTVLGDGGGVCQVSTTVFRAAMNAGLPITERWAHAYRVGYYEQNSKPGIDATIFSPSKDFKFKNDTPGHILIQTINDPKNLHLVVEIYGTSDGRVATVSEPKVWGISPPPPDLYQDDPSIPAGQVRQVDWSAWGAKTSFEYRVVRNGETLQEKTFSSSYRPWQNVYLRGTGPTSAQ